ncbi:Sau3AI family type II restriction endonuclease [Olsenella sp. DNF00959]|uniref:Sau3AI family type II restriction endonuclease n=1 Tax=Olsenella sp. DNF00959 TaxID=1476999 RepID=UPI0007861C43|nr:Sau3AI family type II restriction endonuclease [Olsenella sp. DNF00959]KXB62566.1 putative DNA mismatch repair endonuclease MutH [Olsenella sp. DNF00959]
MTKSLPYDPKSIESIIEYAVRLEGHTLREFIGLQSIDDPHKRRGAFGDALEKDYFNLELNSNPNPDFEEVGLELKSTPLRRNSKGKLSAKERLTVGQINYMDIVNERFETSHFLKKINDVLIVSYEWEKNISPVDYVVKLVFRWRIPEEDLPQIRHDWETVVQKIRDGRAEDISCSDTIYLEAATKAANNRVTTEQPFSSIGAKPRAWAFKRSYMDGVTNDQLEKKAQRIKRSEEEKETDLLTLIRARFRPFFGMADTELVERLEIPKSKSSAARVTNRILGVGDADHILEFEKAGIKSKTMKLRMNGMPIEALSFPSFDYFELEKRPFEESDFLGYLQRMYLFVIYRMDDHGVQRLTDVCFWQMPDKDLSEARRCYEQMQKNVREGRADKSVRSNENRCCHVRPHAQRRSDTRPQPHGAPTTKKSFWLNQGYLKTEIERVLKQQ